MSHFAYVLISYAASTFVVLALVAWVIIDQRARKAELAALELRGVRRRSDSAPAKAEHG